MFLFLLSIDDTAERNTVADEVLSDLETEVRIALILAGFQPSEFHISRLETPDDF